MGAISMVLNAILSSGDEVLYIGGFFGGTYTLVDETLKRFGVKSSFCEVDDFKHIETTAQPTKHTQPLPKKPKNGKLIYR